MMFKHTDRPPIRIVLKYVLLQLPGQVLFLLFLLLVRRWVEAPPYLVWALFGIWVGKDIVLFPFLWRFYDPHHYPDRFSMAGRTGVALTRLNPNGYAQVKGERWQAVIQEELAPIEKGETICVEDISGLELTVKSCTGDGKN